MVIARSVAGRIGHDRKRRWEGYAGREAGSIGAGGDLPLGAGQGLARVETLARILQACGFEADFVFRRHDDVDRAAIQAMLDLTPTARLADLTEALQKDWARRPSETAHGPPDIEYLQSPALRASELERLFNAAWPDRPPPVLDEIRTHSLGYIGAISKRDLVGFVNLAWDGSRHAFLLDTAVHPDRQREGIGRRLVHEAVQLAQSRGVEWVHVDYVRELQEFYESCGFGQTHAGLVKIS